MVERRRPRAGQDSRVSDARVPRLSETAAAAAGDDAGVHPALAELNIFRTLLRRPLAAKATADLLISLLFRGVLDDRLRELVIMRIGWATRSDYEWTQHWTIAQETFGCSAEELLALRDWEPSDRFDGTERVVLGAVDETLATGTISESTAQQCRDRLGDDGLLELVLAVGVWRMISQVARSLAIPLEDGVASWPPDGVAPS